MLVLLVLFFSILISCGTYCIACELSNLSTEKASRVLLLSYMQDYNKGTKANVLLTAYCRKINRLVKIEISKDNKLVQVLDTIHFSVQPEIYILKPIVMLLFLLVAALPLLWIDIVLFVVTVFFLGIAILCYSRKAYCTYNRYMDEIASELSNFILLASRYFELEDSVIGFINLYYNIARTALKEELDRLKKEIENNGQEKALKDMKQRLQQKEIQAVIDGLLMEPKGRKNYFKTLYFQKNQKKVSEVKKKFQKKLIIKRIYFFILLSLWGIFLCYFFLILRKI